MGIYLEGLFISSEYRQYEERDTLAIVVAVVHDEKTNMHRVYMADRYNPDDFAGFKPGDKVSLRARPYVSLNGKLSWADGEIA